MAIGTAEITIKAVVKGFKSEIRAALKDIGTAPENAGKRAGREFTKGFKETSGNRIFSEVKKQLKDQGAILAPYAKKVGRKVGRSFAEGFRETSGVRLFTEFKKEVREAPIKLGPQVYKSGRKTGKEFSAGFRDGAGDDLFSKVRKELNEVVKDNDRLKRAVGGKDNAFRNLKNEAEGARVAFNRLVRAGYLIGPAVAGAASAIGDLIFGLFSVGSAVGAAAPALAVLPGLLAAIGQGALTAKLAFGGVTKGIGALLKQKTGKGGDGGAADNAIADARKRLAMAYQSAAEKMAAANDKVRKAQIALNQAYQDGAESLQQLGFDAEDAALAQSKAAIELERARESLLRTQDVPVDSRARREAEIAFKEAELNYRKAVDKSNDLKKAQDYAAKTGIEGTKEVLSAKQDLSDAESDRAKTERDNAQDILEAQDALQKALQKTNSASSDSVDLLKDLSAEAKRFAKYIASLKPAFLDLKAAAGKELFGPLTIAVQMIVNKLFPVLKPMLTAMGGVMGQLAQRFAEMLTRVGNLDILKRVFGGANITIMQNLGHAFVDIAEAALNILDAVSPLTVQFSAFVRKVADNLVGIIRYKNATGELANKFQKAAEIAKRIGALFSSAYGAFKSFGGAATEAGVKIINAFKGAFDKLKAFSDEGKRTGELQKKFDAIADNFIAMGALLGEIGKALFAISGSAGVKAFLEGVKPIPMIFAEMSNKLTSTGSIFAELLVNAVKLLNVFTESGGITMFLSILNQALKVILAVFSNEIVQKVFLFLAAVKGVTLAIGTLVTVSKFAGKVVYGNFLFMAKGATTAGGATTALNTKIIAFNGLLTKATNRLIGMQIGMVTGSKGAGTFRKSLTLVGQNLRTTITKLGELIKALVLTGFEALKTGFKFIFSSRGIKAFGRAFTGPIKMMAAFTKQIWLNTIAWMANPIGAIVTVIVLAIAALAAVVFGAYKKSEKFQKAVHELGSAIKNSLGQALKLISGAFKNIMPGVSSLSDALKKVGDWIAKYVMPAVQFLIIGGIKVLAAYITYLIGVFKIFFNVLVAPFRLIFAFFKSLFTWDWSILKNTFISVVDGIIGGVNTIIDAINSINPFKDIPHVKYMDAARQANEEYVQSQKNLPPAVKEANAALQKQKDAAANLYKEFGTLDEIQAKVRQGMEESFDKVTSYARGLIDGRHAAKDFKDAQTTLITAIKDGTLSLEQKKDALFDYAGATLDAAKKNIELGKSSDSTKKIIEKGRTAFLEQAKALKIPADEARRLADNLALTPNTIKKAFEVTGLKDLQEGIDKLKTLQSTIQVGSKEYKAYVKKIKKQFPNLSAKQIDEKVMKEVGGKITALEANINQVMTVNFGKGQKEGDPLFVKVTNPGEVKKGEKDKGKYTGGQVKGGSTYLVGERGPELFQAPTSGNIVPNHQVGMGNTINLTVNPSPGMDERELANLMSRRLAFLQRGA